MLTAGSEIDVVERVNYRLFHSLGPRTDSYMYTVRHVELARLLLMWWLSLQLFFNWGSPIALVTLWLSKWPGDGFKLQCCCCMSSVMVLGLSWLWVQDGFRAVDWCQDHGFLMERQSTYQRTQPFSEKTSTRTLKPEHTLEIEFDPPTRVY